MTNALIFRALERNTGSVGLASAACKSIKAVNPEIAALQQHQDPASTGAQATNKAIAQELVRQIAAIGGDTSLGNEASTFAPGKIGDPTGAGNTCDDANDAKGCINTLGLRVNDLTAAEITAAAAGSGAATGNATAADNAAAGNAANGGAANGKAGKGKGAKGNANNNAANNAANNNAASNNAATNDNAASCNAGANGNAAAASNNNNAATGKKGAASGNAASGNAASGNAASGNAASGNAASGNAASGNAASGNAASGNAASGNAAGNAAGNTAATGGAASGAASGAAAFGNCNPTIKFGLPSDGRKEDAFEPADLATFNHGSALNIAVISNFICTQVGNKCKVNAAAISTCNSAATAANGLKGQAAATAFNSALGF
ncbi:uncharacterized protein SETTUDRAFT_163650 [Exserohilum turcica Et28A]|uniref:Uncharacterized protein n=1 Tax=Exserohilum turcicum (strain 28A) TaxID=671987 RepID=R0K980_EXST2|nr:uncharacterized protein SETTUDRAFT_163650 [Exserohilum turcica Et28A]EOA84832.1 hypothetical protein SETTUDRAFT_163650 [Exserohilum turcica Et28A]